MWNQQVQYFLTKFKMSDIDDKDQNIIYLDKKELKE